MIEYEEGQPFVPPGSNFFPPWMDPTFMLQTSAFRPFQITPNNFGDGPLIPANPKRWAIGFIRNAAALDPTVVAPWQPLRIQGIILDNLHYFEWFYLFKHGPIVCSEWYVQSTDTMNPLSWCEVVLQ